MLYSTITPAKNEEQVIPVLLESLSHQTLFGENEMIIADAHSTDRTREIAKAAGAIIVDGGMPGVGRNAGARIAKGDWFLFIDADAKTSSPSWIESCLKEMGERNLDVATCDLIPQSNDLADHLYHKIYNWYVRLTANVIAHAPGSCIFVSRKAFEHAGGFDESVIFAEDMEFVQRLTKLGYRFGILNAGPEYVSVRRLKKDGYFTTAWRYCYTELYMLFVGPVRKPLFDYRFNHFFE